MPASVYLAQADSRDLAVVPQPRQAIGEMERVNPIP
jgi:hypothetical protein